MTRQWRWLVWPLHHLYVHRYTCVYGYKNTASDQSQHINAFISSQTLHPLLLSLMLTVPHSGAGPRQLPTLCWQSQ